MEFCGSNGDLIGTSHGIAGCINYKYLYICIYANPQYLYLALRYLLSLGAQTISSLPNNVLSIIYIDVELICHIEKVELS